MELRPIWEIDDRTKLITWVLDLWARDGSMSEADFKLLVSRLEDKSAAEIRAMIFHCVRGCMPELKIEAPTDPEFQKALQALGIPAMGEQVPE